MGERKHMDEEGKIVTGSAKIEIKKKEEPRIVTGSAKVSKAKKPGEATQGVGFYLQAEVTDDEKLIEKNKAEYQQQVDAEVLKWLSSTNALITPQTERYRARQEKKSAEKKKTKRGKRGKKDNQEE